MEIGVVLTSYGGYPQDRISDAGLHPGRHALCMFPHYTCLASCGRSLNSPAIVIRGHILQWFREELMINSTPDSWGCKQLCYHLQSLKRFCSHTKLLVVTVSCYFTSSKSVMLCGVDYTMHKPKIDGIQTITKHGSSYFICLTDPVACVF